MDSSENDVLLCNTNNLLKDISNFSTVWIGHFFNDENLCFVLEGEENYEGFRRLLKTYGIAFSVDKSNLKRRGKVLFSVGRLGIQFFGHPFRVLNNITFNCIYGPSKPKKPKPSTVNDHRKKRKRLIRRQNDCRAQMFVRVIEYFPEYVVEGSLNIHDRKASCMKQLKSNLNSDKNVCSKLRYYISMSDPKYHTHQLRLRNSLKSRKLKTDIAPLQNVENSLSDSDVFAPSEESANFCAAEFDENSHPKQRQITLFDLKTATRSLQNLLHLLPADVSIHSYDLKCEITSAFQSVNVLREKLRPFLSLENDLILKRYKKK